MGTIFRSPLIQDRKNPAPGRSDVYDAPDALLRPNPDRPWHQDDWPQAASPRRALQPDFTVPPPNALLYPNPTRPWHQDDWPSTARSRQPQASDAPANFLPLSTPVAVTAPFALLDWPALQGLRPLKSDVYDSPDSLLRPNPLVPWHQDDWPAAVRARPPIASPDFIERISALYTPNPDRPWHQDDWPRPSKAYPPALVDLIEPLSTLLRPNPDRPWHADDWPLPTRAKPPIPPPDFLQTIAALYTPNPSQPWHQDDWASPARLRLSWRGEAIGFQPPAPVVTTPFANYDWPNTARTRPAQQQDAVENSDALNAAPSEDHTAGFIANLGRMMTRH